MNQIRKAEQIQFILTHKCNLNCAYCLRQSGSDRSEMDFETIKNIIKGVEFKGSKNCVLTGGEAALHSRFWDIIDFFGKQDFSIYIESNGFALDEQWLKKLLKYIDKSHLTFLISMDHYDEQVHDAFRGRGKHKRAEEAIMLLRNNGITVDTNTVIHRKNFFSRLELYKMLEFLCELKINRACFSPIVSIGNNQDDKYSLTQYEILLSKEIITELKNRFSGRINVGGFNDEIGGICNRINSQRIVVSYKGYHPCLYLDNVVIESLGKGIRNNFKYVDALPYLKRAVDIDQENNTNACWSCCKSFQKFGANLPFRISIDE